jgi:sporulation protein YlmC with PRC-barrel domain
MRNTMTTGLLEPLGHSNLELVDRSEDIRGRKVVDREGQDVGKVDEVWMDHEQRQARFLTVKSGDILGIGGQKYLVPVEAITYDGDRVAVNATADRITQGPQVDQIRPDDAASLETGQPRILEVYDFYAVKDPFWSPTYQQPRWQ